MEGVHEVGTEIEAKRRAKSRDEVDEARSSRRSEIAMQKAQGLLK